MNCDALIWVSLAWLVASYGGLGVISALNSTN
jgi:hypothetical protein